jgi:protein ImuA
VSADVAATLCRLRQAVTKIEGQTTDLGLAAEPLRTGIADMDARLKGGLARGGLHEIAPEAPRDFGAAAGFVLALAARADRRPQTLWILTDHAAGESGDLYGPGSELFGLSMRHLLLLKVRRPVDVLWAAEEALKSGALASVIAELPGDAPLADLTATRRLTLAVRDTGSLAFLLRHRPSVLTSSAETRWEVAAASSEPDRFGGMGRTTLALSLVKNRRGPIGRFLVAWDHHERVFTALSVGVAAAVADRPVRAPRASAG